MKNLRKTLAGILAVAAVISMTSCNGGGNTRASTTAAPNPEASPTEAGTEAAVTTAAQTAVSSETNDTDVTVQEIVSNIEVDTELKPEKKIQWLSWWDIDETSAEVELFKANYGIPEQGSKAYGDDFADRVFVYTTVSYQDRYDKLGQMVSSGNSPDMFEFEIGYYPLSAYKGMFQSIDGIIDTNSDEWSGTRAAMDKFMWGGKNYTPIIHEGVAALWYYRRSVVEEAGLPDPYELYKNGEWDWNAMLDMADKFQQTGENKYLCDGWYVQKQIVLTTGVPVVGLEDGKLINNMNNSNIERAMDVVSKLCAEGYGYPKVENGWQLNEKLWTAGNILFFVDGKWWYQGNGHKYVEKLGWDTDDLFFVPAPRDPLADNYYIEKKVDPFMLVSGSDNLDGYKAWIKCNLIVSKDEEVQAAAREKIKNDEKWTDDQLDFIKELEDGDAVVGIYDFKNGISTACANSDGSSPTDKIINEPYNSVDNTYTGLRAENEGEIKAAIDELNASIGA
ncbi:MAG: carbohydrate ABC transporter substrate-binding protein, CUT1 family [Ruminiclostridium sp.]|nr:carbohydrate ABC transporter substrate-binding protein, CUT1 family [Ruminiclostridium sp.]